MGNAGSASSQSTVPWAIKRTESPFVPPGIISA
jgi:hypothetical protein